MAGRFEGLSDLEGRLFADIFPPAPPKRGRGMPHVPFRQILHTLLSILIPGCRWCDAPCGPQWASQSATHRWWQRWQADGTLAAMHARMLGIAAERGMIRGESGAVAGAVSPWEGGRRGGRPRGARPRDAPPPPHRGQRDALGEPHHARQRGCACPSGATARCGQGPHGPTGAPP
jgi:transposase